MLVRLMEGLLALDSHPNPGKPVPALTNSREAPARVSANPAVGVAPTVRKPLLSKEPGRFGDWNCRQTVRLAVLGDSDQRHPGARDDEQPRSDRRIGRTMRWCYCREAARSLHHRHRHRRPEPSRILSGNSTSDLRSWGDWSSWGCRRRRVDGARWGCGG